MSSITVRTTDNKTMSVPLAQVSGFIPYVDSCHIKMRSGKVIKARNRYDQRVVDKVDLDNKTVYESIIKLIGFGDSV